MHWKPKSWILIGLLLTALTAAKGVGQVATTPVADTVYHANGTSATGSVLISWPAFTTSNGDSIPSGSTSAVIGLGGALRIQLIANAGSTPMGSYYTVVYHLDDGSVSRQYWVVPASTAAVKVSAIESTVLPTSVAMQTVSKSYVDVAIAAAVTGHSLDSTPYLLKAGDTMTGPLALPADPVSPMQAANKNYVDGSVAALMGGLGQKVSTLPLDTQVVSQPTGTELSVNNLNGVKYASQYVDGRGDNGIANAVSSPDCANGCEVNAEQGYTNEKYYAPSMTGQTHVHDARGGRQVDSYTNPLDVVGHGLSIAQTIDHVSTQSAASIVQQTGNSIPGAIAVSITQEGLAGGSNLFPEQIESPPYFKMGYSALMLKGVYNTQGQHGLMPQEIDCYGVGDCLMGSRFIYASGGIRDSADEGAHPFDLQTHEDFRVFLGTCASGCTSGSTNVVITQNSGGGTQGDGRFLIDTNPAKAITSAGTGGVIVGGSPNGPHASAQFSGTNFPVSVFLSAGQVIPSQANNMAPGAVTFSIATGGVPSGYATSTAAIPALSRVACVVDQTAGYAPQNYEMAPYTVVDATHLQMTLNKPHQILATLAFGGLCGYGLEQIVDTTDGIRQVFPVVGTYSPAGLYYAGGTTPVVGAMNQTSGFLNFNASIASATRSGNIVTVTVPGNLGADINGLAVTVSGVSDSSYNGIYVATTTGGNSFTYVQSGANSSSAGGTVSVLTGGFAFYPMAEVLSVFDQATKSVDGQMTLAPNNVAWAANDSVEQPHYYQEMVSADTELIGQYVPRPSVTMRAGLQYQQNNGPGLVGWSIANAAPSTNYLGYGGTHGFPDAAYEATGIWRRTMNLSAGEQAVFGIHCSLHGCGNWNSGYNLFELDSNAGADIVAYSPTASALSMVMRGTPYSFSPQAFTAGTINAGTLNVSTINGTLSGGNITSGTIAASHLPLFGASGSVHGSGIVPDPGASAGSTRFLREDGTWVAPTGGGRASGGANIVAGALADYAFNDGAGTTLADQTGNGNNGTLRGGGNAPAWLATGLQFNIPGLSGVQLPSALNISQTVFIAAYINPMDINSVNGGQSMFVSSNMAGDSGTNLMIGSGLLGVGVFSPWVHAGSYSSFCTSPISGFHVVAYQLGVNPSPDRIWIDGSECTGLVSLGADAGVQTSGNLYLGSSGVGKASSQGFAGSMYRAVFYAGHLSDAQMQSMNTTITSQVTAQGIPTSPVDVRLTAPQLHAIGDSITFGLRADFGWPSALSLTRQPGYSGINWGVPGALLAGMSGSEANRVGTRCMTTAGASVAIVFAGTNDFVTQGSNVSQVIGSYASEIQTLKHSGCHVYVATMLSRSQGRSYDPEKNALDELLISQAKAMGADGVVDFAADPNLGADGAYANATYFSDQTHPTNAGQARLGLIASNALNYYFGYTVGQPHVIATTPYTLTSADGAVTAAPAGASAYTMPDCTGPSGAAYTISNPQSAFAVTITGGASQPINGLATAITIPSNSTVTLHDVPNPKTVSGCHWTMSE